ncbi:hypothetical protein JAAARDRAFT_142329 [Jaapia argillacea MUCL 33604]|uniref:ribonuclease H n=1 Tax=Jaapia argillacea MUCL 33604 TaxID=933084 RepID=A0A067P5I4_9AGAM|nr:hypothetical protein JAAARDRAFT_142329 [Jaapia argillacea MUCL 33604]
MPPAYRLTNPLGGHNLIDEHLVVYTNGSCTRNGTASALCGIGIWIADGHPKNMALRVPGVKQSNQVGEIAAIVACLQGTDNCVPITLVTDSLYVIEGLTKHLGNWEDRGWIGIANCKFFQAVAYQLCRRSATTAFRWVKGHSGDIGNDKADALAKQGASRDVPDQLDLSVPPNFHLSGAKLATITQSVAYRGIRERVHHEERRKSAQSIDMVRSNLEEIHGHLETDKAIWARTWSKDLQRKIGQFLFMMIHQAQKIGTFWVNIPTFEERGRCGECDGEIESMEHILLDCQARERQQVWKMAEDLWLVRRGNWPRMSLGLIMGCGSVKIHTPGVAGHEPKVDRGATQLIRILISESAHLIWAMRCQQVIQGITHTCALVAQRWQNTMNQWLTIDRILNAKTKQGPQGGSRQTKQVGKEPYKMDTSYQTTGLPPSRF